MLLQSPMLLLIVAFAMLWVPLGQHTFLIEHWMKLGTFMAPFILLVAFSFRLEPTVAPKTNVRFLSLIMLVAYIAHQFEEHWIDLYGNTFAFKTYLNSMLLSQLGATDGAVILLSDAGIFMINTSLVWLLASLAICLGSRNIFPALCMTAIILVNAFSHIIASISSLNYNPGVLTAIVIFIPTGVLIYAWFLQSKTASLPAVGASIVWGILAHIFMVSGIILSGWNQLIPEVVYFGFLVIWSVVPAIYHQSNDH
ncbi:MAG: HXXEE domain-containing protein [Pseudomonadota bacterium]